MHADFAEIDLGAHKGNLQFSYDENRLPAGAPVSLRGRFETAEGVPLALQLMGAQAVKGRSSSQFELAGAGPTLGTVIDSATGRGSLDARDGQIELDLAAMQKFAMGSGLSEPRASLGAFMTPSPFDALEAKFQMLKGAFAVDQARVRSRGLIATGQGRLGFKRGQVDASFRLSPSPGPGPLPQRQSASKIGPPDLRSSAGSSGNMLAIRGPLNGLVLSLTETQAAP